MSTNDSTPTPPSPDRWKLRAEREEKYGAELRSGIVPTLKANSAPPPTLPDEVREAIARMQGYGSVEELHQQSETHIDRRFHGNICAALAPLWPRPAPVTADGVAMIAAEINRIAAVLAPVLARLQQAEGELEGLTLVHAKSVEERIELRARAAAAEAAQVAAERELSRWIEQLSLETNTGPTGDLMATSRAWQAVRRERDALRADVERLTKERDTAVKHSNLAVRVLVGDDKDVTLAENVVATVIRNEQLSRELADLRAQLAAVREDKERLNNLRVSAEKYASDFKRERDDLRTQLAAAEQEVGRLEAEVLTSDNRAGAYYAKEVTDLRAQLADARQAVAAALADKERLDWLEANLCYAMVAPDGIHMTQLASPHGKGWQNGNLRIALDTARREGGRHD